MMKALIPAILALATAVNCYGQDKWLNIYKEVDNVPRVVANPVANISNIQHQGLEQDKYDTMILTVDGEEIAIDMSQIEKCVIGHNIPTISIETDEYVDEIPSKEYYLTGKVSMAGYGNYDDLKSTAVNIKGRGNSTWYYDKKPYRLKFDKKISICGLTKAKNYVLLANYIDPTLMRNAVALKIAQLLGISYTNHCIPVNLILNGKYRGSYMLTEKVGLNSASVDVKDEAKAILFELDTNYDEAYKFKSPIYNLPVMDQRS
jgi:spore coat protein CotH